MKTQSPSSIEYIESLRTMFEYDREAPLDVEEIGVESVDGVSIHDTGYSSRVSGRVKAWLVTPEREGTYPALIFVHPAPGNRDTFLNEARSIARQGAVCLLPDAPWARGEAWGRTLGEPEHDRAAFIGWTVDLRRAVDFLVARSDTDAGRIGYIGHSLGALFGGVLSGIEKRIGAFVLMAGTGNFIDVITLNLPSLQGAALERYEKEIAPIDPVNYVRHAAPSALLFQFGVLDKAFPPEMVVKFVEAGSEPKEVRWYEADHFLNDRARTERAEWLRTRLELGSGAEVMR